MGVFLVRLIANVSMHGNTIEYKNVESSLNISENPQVKYLLHDLCINGVNIGPIRIC